MRPISPAVKRLFHHFSAKTHSSAVQRELCVHASPPPAKSRPPLKRPSFRRALSSTLHIHRNRPKPLGVQILRYQSLPAVLARVGTGISSFSHSIRIKYSDINSMVCATCIGAVRPFRAGFGHRQMASIREIESARPNLAICRSVAANLLRRTRMEPAFSARSCDFGAPKSGTIRVNHSIYFDNTRSASSGFLAARNCQYLTPCRRPDRR